MLAPRVAIQSNRFRLSLGLALVATLSTFSATHAQDNGYQSDDMLAKYVYKEIPEDLDTGEKRVLRGENSDAKKLRSADKRAATTSLEGSFNESQIKPYLDGLILSMMTQTDDDTLSKLGSLRASFLKDYVQDTPSGNREQLLNTVLIPFAQKVTSNNYHPAVQLNAVLLIGMINDSDPGSRGVVASPSATCINYLVDIMNDTSSAEFLKVGAMTGLHRIAQFDSVATPSRISSGDRNKIGTIAFDITQKVFAGQDQWKPETSYWLRRRSIQILGFLKDPGTGNVRANALFDIVNDSAEKLWIRFDALMALHKMNLNLANADQLLEKATMFLVDALRLEAKTLEIDLNELVAINLLYGSVDLLGSESAGGGGGRAPGGRGGGRGGDARGGGARGGGRGGGRGGSTNFGRGLSVIDLPIYRTNDSRRYVQGIAANVVTILTDLDDKVSDEKEPIRLDLIDDINKLIEKANVGLIDLANPPEPVVPVKGVPPKGIADQMIEIFNGSAKQIDDLVNGNPGGGGGDSGLGLPGQ